MRLKILISVVLLATASTTVYAQDLMHVDEGIAANDFPKLQSALVRLMLASTSDERFSEATLRGTTKAELATGRERVILEAYTIEKISEIEQAVLAVGGNKEGSYERFVQALVPIASLETLSSHPDVRLVRFPRLFTPDQGGIFSEGREAIGADLWQKAGLTGEGVKVAIFDAGFRGYKSLLGQDLPPEDRVTVRGFGLPVEGFSDDPDDEASHGTAVAEIVYDIAPGAQFFLVNALTVDVNVPQAVNYLIQQGVDVINTSWGAFSGCLNGGFLEKQFQRARQAGITWAASAGNDGESHWQGQFRDDDDDGRLNFTATDETNSFQARADDTVSIILSWEDPCRSSKNNYDLLLLDNQLNVVASSTDDNSVGEAVEFISFHISRTGTYHIAVEKSLDAQPVLLDLVFVNAELEHSVPEGSISFFEPAISSNVLTVGAVFWQNNRLERFSSQGPTKDGRMKPDISGPDGVTSRTFDPFFGTSASSPHVAGAAVLVKQAFPADTPEQIQQFLAERAEDFGPSGSDNQYGAGVLLLGQPPSSPPTITGIDPTSGLQGSTIQASISGTKLSGATAITFTDSGVTAVLRSGLTDTSLPISITIAPDAAPGTRSFTVTTPLGIVTNSAVTFTVLQAPRLGVEPESLNFQATVGKGDPPAQTLHLTNPGGGTLNWQASVDAPWLRISATEGTAPAELTVSIAIAGLAAGTYEGRVTITAFGALNSPVVVPVKLVLEAPTGQLVVLVFTKLEFPKPEDWTVSIQGGCALYQNTSGNSSPIRVTLPDDSVREFDVPANREVLACGSVVHIDTR